MAIPLFGVFLIWDVGFIRGVGLDIITAFIYYTVPGGKNNNKTLTNL